MRRFVPFLAAFALLTATACSEQASSPTGADVVPEDGAAAGAQGMVDMIVQLDREFAPGAHAANKDRAAAVARELGVTPRYSYGTALFGFAGPVPEGRLTALEKDPRVVSVERDQPVHAIAQTLPAGIDRIQAGSEATSTAVDADIAIIDTGIDLDHPDLNVGTTGADCIDDGKSTTNDDAGHGTHVAGSAAAIDNGSHVVGAAPGARVHPVKVLDSGGSGTISSIICGIDHVTANADVFEVANMSLGAQGQSGDLRTAIQNSVDAGIVHVVAAGNDASDVYGSDGTFGTSDDFIPAAYPEVAAVSAMADFDGSAGGNGGRQIFSGCGPISDDTFAECFSNFSGSVVSTNPVSSPGAAIDVAAPGVSVLSTTNDGGTGSMSGTSMASPHVAGLAALYIASNGAPSDPAGVYDVRQALIDAGQAQADWGGGDTGDPDGNLEPLAQASFTDGGDGGTTDDPPSVTITNPSDGATVSGTVTIEAEASDDGSVSQVEFFVDGGSIGTDTDGSDGWSATWNTTNYSDADHTVSAEATDDAGQTTSDQITVTVDNTTDTGDTAPSIDAFSHNTRTTGPWSRADVTWSVSDADGDLATVTSRLLDASGNALDSATSSVSGGSASGEHSLRTRSSAAEVVLEVTDSAGNTTTATRSY